MGIEEKRKGKGSTGHDFKEDYDNSQVLSREIQDILKKTEIERGKEHHSEQSNNTTKVGVRKESRRLERNWG